ncbi:MAG: IclR family transcriptional regulator [Planctomycetes bacterium]|nr:IclR family transcriptional regulator [Planctomycetota bacterium]
MMEATAKRGRNRTRKEVPSIRALERGLLVLEVLGDGGIAPLSDIARATQLSCSTTFRILETLRQRGYVEQDKITGHYYIGFKALQIGAAYSAASPLPQASHAVMEELVEKINETANLAILDNNEAVYIHQVQSQHSIRMFTQLGARAPLHCTGVGKVLLAWQSTEQIEKLLGGRRFKAFTSTTITRFKKMMTELDRVRQKGFAVDNEEREPGVRCVTAPVRDAHGTVVAALSISAPTTRFPKKQFALWSREVVSAAGKVSSRLGYVSRDRHEITK